MLQLIRLVTVHPVFVHVTIGALPILVIAYALAALRRSERFTFAGDVVTVTAAVITLGTLAFGLVSNFTLRWPGGTGSYRGLHLAFGIATTVLLVALAAARIVLRRRVPVSGMGTLAAALGVALVGGFTGWIGGEVLVYRAGMAVLGAGDGSLAQPVSKPTAPKDLLDAMGHIRAHWASALVETSWMNVHHPEPARFDAVARDAQRLRELARWMADHGAASLDDPNERMTESPEREAAADPPDAGAPRAPSGPNQPEERRGEARHDAAGAPPQTRAQHLRVMSLVLGLQSQSLLDAARAHDLEATAVALGQMSAACADCHEDLRWSERGGDHAPAH